MDIRLSVQQGIFILKVDGDLDMYNTPALKDSFNKVILKQPAGILLNLEGVGYLDSSGIGVLLYMQNRVTKEKIPFFITELQNQPAKVLELTKLTNYFPFADSVSVGLARLAKENTRQY